MTKTEIYNHTTKFTWLFVWQLNSGRFQFTILKRMSGSSRNSPLNLLSSVQYIDLLLLFHHAVFLQEFSEKLVTEVTEYNLSTFHYYELKASYFAMMQRTFFESGRTHFSIFPINTTARELERRVNVCLAEQTRKVRVSGDRGLIPTSLDLLWREFYKFDFGGGGSADKNEK